MRTSRILFAFLLLIPPAASAEDTWYKGNTHTHSLWSDGDDFPDMIVDWYRERGYHFLVLSDHNVLSRGERWIGLNRLRNKQALPKYRERFGEQVDLRTVDGKQQVRLKTYPELQKLFDRPGSFLLVEGEEITDSGPDPKNFLRKLPVHINAMNLSAVIKPRGGKSVPEVMRNNLRAVREQEAETGRAILDHLNHPNFHYAISVEDLAAVVEERFFEVYNGHPGVRQTGDGKHPGVVEMWDRVNALRVFELDADPLYGLATDDSHTYHGGKVSPGRGWVMVRAAELEANALVKAMRRGDFYASTGVRLDRLDYDPDKRRLRLAVAPDGDARFTIKVIGLDRDTMAGRELQRVEGRELDFILPADAHCVRAEVVSSKAHPNPSYRGQVEQAWTQPVGWR